jgi:hypothetical protein
MKRSLCFGTGFLALLAALGAGYNLAGRRAVVQAAGPQAPNFEVDPMWPKPLPNHWILGSVMGVSVDSQDHIWIVQRGAPTLERMELYATTDPPGGDCCTPAPPVLEFDEAGNLLRHWGGPGEGYEWPAWVNSILVDAKGNVWIAGGSDSGVPAVAGRGGRGGARGGRGEADAGGAAVAGARGRGPGGGRGAGAGGGAAAAAAPVGGGEILKFTADGKFLMKIGDPKVNANSNDTANLKGPTKMVIDKATNELYVADGIGAKRVIVFDADTGQYKRHWGAYGNKPDDADLGKYNPDAPAAKQFANPVRCVEMANDGTVYVCDPINDRIQAFKKDGTFLKEAFIEKKTLGDGTVWEIGFSKDPQQKYMYVADGTNDKIHILQRDTLDVLTNFGDGGRQPGLFYAVAGISADNKGNLFTVEAYRGNRVQKFLYKGLGTVTKQEEGYLWPKH